MKIVINSKFGGFELSQKAKEMLRGMGETTDESKIKRDSKALVFVVETLGEEANEASELEVVTIPDDADWIICENDGYEWVAERSKRWS